MINDRYKILKLLGEGRSRVYLCEDTLHGNMPVALKLLDPGKTEYEIKNFREEYIKLKKLNSNNIVKSYEYGTVVSTGKKEFIEEIEKGALFFTLEYVEGKTLSGFYNGKDEKKLKEIIRQISSVLFYLHESNFIYYDLKPENIIVAEGKNNFILKFIDFGLAEYNPQRISTEKKGTSYYIAPELLTGREHDKRVDFYAFGMLLYFLMFRKFPFTGKDEIEIYKEKLASGVSIGKTGYTEKLINVVNKLLRKNPRKRYNNALEILRELNLQHSSEILKKWKPVKSFHITDSTLEVTDFIFRQDTDKVLNIIGESNAGKTSLAEEIYQNFHAVLWVTKNDIPSEKLAWEIILRKIIYADFVYDKLTGDIKQTATKLLNGESSNIGRDLIYVLNFVTSAVQFVIFLDDFDLYDLFTKNLIENILTIFVVNKAKLIALTKTKFEFSAENAKSIKRINLKPFTEFEAGQLITKTFSAMFPRKEMKKLVIQHTALYPGNIYEFCESILSNGMLSYRNGQIKLNYDKNKLENLTLIQKEGLRKKTENLTAGEFELLSIISVFQKGIEPDILIKLSREHDYFDAKINFLINNGILKKFDDRLKFSSELLKKEIYKNIPDKKKFHLHIANKLESAVPDFPRVELAEQYELAGEYGKVRTLILEEIDSMEESGLFGYERKLLEYLLSLPLSEEDKFSVKQRLSKVFYNLGEFPKSLKLIEELKKIKHGKLITGLKLLEADNLVAVGKVKDAIKIYNQLSGQTANKELHFDIIIKLANAESYANLYYQAKAKCFELINRSGVPERIKAQAFNLLGIIEHNLGGDARIAENYFIRSYEIYKELNLTHKLARISVNLGNLSNIRGDQQGAKKWWDKALEIHKKNGNLEGEMAVLMNYGVLFTSLQDFERAAKYFSRALKIALGLNKKYETGLIYYNTAEVETFMCEYEKAIEYLKRAKEIFNSLENYTETGEANYLLTWIYFIINCENEFDKYFDEYKRNFKFSQNPAKEFLDRFLALLRGDIKGQPLDIEKIETMLESSVLQNEKIIATQFYQFLFKKLFETNRFDLLEEVINSSAFRENEKNNILIRAEKFYWLGKINKAKGDKISCIANFEAGFEKLNNVEINELTWKITIELAEIYFERGDINKASEYLEITENILQFISSKFKDFELRNAYIQNKERLETIKKIERWQTLIH